MRQSRSFIKTLRQPPAGETSASARLLEQAGFVYKQMAGVYAYLPLGWRVFQKVSAIIREELDRLGAVELYLPALQSKTLWQKTGRWHELAPIMYQFTDHAGHAIGLGATHEEAITQIVAGRVTSYKDLPLALYQIQDKFRDEPRARSGLIRAREFAMKDLYSFHADQANCDQFYEQVKGAYQRIFERCSLPTIVVEGSGGTFTKQHSHEFQVITDSGEDKIFYNEKTGEARNQEIATANDKEFVVRRGIEVGNIFKLGTKFSEALQATFTTAEGKEKPMAMASYGIGPGRVMATIVELHHDQDGIVWPESVAPFDLHLLALSADSSQQQASQQLYENLAKQSLDILFDDRAVAPGVKLKDADLIGIPQRLVMSDKTGPSKIEYKKRTEKNGRLLTEQQLSKLLSQ